MEIEQEILLNKYGQELVPINLLIEKFGILNNIEKKSYLQHLVCLIAQSKSADLDIQQALMNSCLKRTFTPCVLLEKGGIKYCNLKKIVDLPINEWNKVLILLLNLFKIGYSRRFLNEKNNPNKWWYWDLSIEENVYNIMHKK